jgi:hypothetical protein
VIAPDSRRSALDGATGVPLGSISNSLDRIAGIGGRVRQRKCWFSIKAEAPGRGSASIANRKGALYTTGTRRSISLCRR